MLCITCKNIFNSYTTKVYNMFVKMTNLKKILLIFVPFMLILSSSYANNISAQSKAKIDSIMTVVERDWGKESIFTQISKYEKFINAFSKAKFDDNEQREMIMYLVECFQKNLNTLKSQVKTQEEVISNVDRNRVKTEWLNWHNEERSKKWLSSYTYSDTLNYTALIRAQQIASEKRKTWSTHARKSGDWYRNTNSIRDWFANLWVNVVYFSESNAYWYYNCKKSDCTQEMIDALKKCFNRTFLDSQHYSAIVSSTFNEIGLWVATNWTYVRVTTHYWKDIQ